MVATTSELKLSFRAMASEIQLLVPIRSERNDFSDAASEARDVFVQVEKECTRFDPVSSLMLANERREEFVALTRYCFDAIVEAYSAYNYTKGLFDPRILQDLSKLGYDRSFSEVPSDMDSETSLSHGRGTPREAWSPLFRPDIREILIGGEAIDLGGIGKGLAVRWAAMTLSKVTSDFLIEAGGDCYASGFASDGGPWRIGIEDPMSVDEHLGIVGISDLACATSSVRFRNWRVKGQSVHHLIDPRSGLPGGIGLSAVTVIGKDPAVAEVWAKSLFLAGSDGIAAEARDQGLAAFWVDDEGRYAYSEDMTSYLVWVAGK